MSRNNELQLSEEAIRGLSSDAELAEVHVDPEENEEEVEETEEEVRIHQAELTSGMSEHAVFTFDRYPKLYMDTAQFLKVQKTGRIEIIKDNTEHTPMYTASAMLAFPHLYFASEKAPLDCCDYQVGRYLLKKQCLFAFELLDNRYIWPYSDDDIHMMWQYGRLVEMRIRCSVGYYLSQHQDTVHMPIDSVLRAFKQGFSEDGALDSHLPGLSTMMSQIPHSREKWFSARMDIDAISRDLGSANVFLTVS